MRKQLSVLAALPLIFGAATSVNAAIISDGSFEMPSLAGTTYGYCYPQAAFAVNCVGEGVEAVYGSFGSWHGDAAAAAARVGSNWGLNGSPPDGVQYGVLQGISSWQHSYTIPTAGQYLLTWWDAGRTNPFGLWDGDQTYVVKMDGPVVASFSTVTGQPFTQHSLLVTLTSGSHSLRFSHLDAVAGDHSAYIDAVSLAPVPEPATASLLLAGFLGLAGLLRHRPRPSMNSPSTTGP